MGHKESNQTNKQTGVTVMNAEHRPQLAIYMEPLPRGRGILIFSYIRRLEPFFGVKNFEFQYFWEFSEKEYLWGNEDCVDIFGGHNKMDYNLGSFLCIIWSFL